MHKDQKGSVSILACAFLSFLALALAFSIDAGYIVMVQHELQNAADAAALAAVTQLPVTPLHAKRLAEGFAREHRAGGREVELPHDLAEVGFYDFETSEFHPDNLPVNAARVTAPRSENVRAGKLPLFFANFFGMHSLALEKKSLAAADPRVVGVHAANHLLPFAVRQALVDQEGDGDFDIGHHVNLPIEPTAPGNFGYLDLNGGANGLSEMINYILYGIPQDFVLPESGVLWTAGKPGIVGHSLAGAFEAIEDEVSYFPVYDQMTGSGANADYHIVGIVALVIRHVHLTGHPSSRHISVEIVTSVSSNFILREDASDNNSLQKLRLVE